eukprot:CAMPEP_0168749306 /NCGR_PEP_ID=MMETSP0724-20121128/16644_1 /TAXON_ID=265536 /ORGANISM="Amphiprora sp., Strain CCMP467" /LENGTH=718 /DNA_ID=CAMNT_0008797203 /DNA_START=62 /DNA_END=2218 /DNA_ORIENTATION=+
MSPRKRAPRKASKKQLEVEKHWLADVYQKNNDNHHKDDHHGQWLPLDQWSRVYEPKKKKKSLGRIRRNFRKKVGRKAKDVALTRLEKALSAKMIRLVLDVTAIVLNRAEDEMEPGPAVTFVNHVSAVVLSYRFVEERSKNMTGPQETYIKHAAVVHLADCMQQMMEVEELEYQVDHNGGGNAVVVETKESPESDVNPMNGGESTTTDNGVEESDAKDTGDAKAQEEDIQTTPDAVDVVAEEVGVEKVATYQKVEEATKETGDEPATEEATEKATPNDEGKADSKEAEEEPVTEEPVAKKDTTNDKGEEAEKEPVQKDAVAEEATNSDDEGKGEAKETGEESATEEATEKATPNDEAEAKEAEEEPIVKEEPVAEQATNNDKNSGETEGAGKEPSKEEPVAENVAEENATDDKESDNKDAVGGDKTILKQESRTIEDVAHGQHSGRAIILARVQRQLRAELAPEKIRPLAEAKIDEAFDTVEHAPESVVHRIKDRASQASESLHKEIDNNNNSDSNHSSVMNSKLAQAIKKASSFSDDSSTLSTGGLTNTLTVVGGMALETDKARAILQRCGIDEPRQPEVKDAMNQDLVRLLKSVMKDNIVYRLEEMSGWILFYLDQLFVAVTLANEVNQTLDDAKKRDTSEIIHERAEEINQNMEATIRQEVGNVVMMFDTLLDKKIKETLSGKKVESDDISELYEDGEDDEDEDEEILDSIEELAE